MSWAYIAVVLYFFITFVTFVTNSFCLLRYLYKKKLWNSYMLMKSFI